MNVYTYTTTISDSLCRFSSYVVTATKYKSPEETPIRPPLSTPEPETETMQHQQQQHFQSTGVQNPGPSPGVGTSLPSQNAQV